MPSVGYLGLSWSQLFEVKCSKTFSNVYSTDRRKGANFKININMLPTK